MFPPSDDAEFLWRLARAARDLSQQPGVEGERKKQLVFEAFDNAKKALERDPNSFAVHKVSRGKTRPGPIGSVPIHTTTFHKRSGTPYV